VSLRHCILGLLSVRPLTGYEIKKLFDETLAYAWNAHDSQIYPELHRMEAKDWITTVPIVDGRRQRKVNAITDAGRAEFQRWLASRNQRTVRDEFLLRVFFFGMLSPKQQQAWLVDEQEDLEATLIRSEKILAQFGEYKPKSPRAQALLRWQLACVDLGVAQVTARLQWVGETAREVAEILDCDEVDPGEDG
jgi:DNA-binding PadR family transcriptional regulator